MSRGCFVCGQDMNEADGCADDRTITFADGEQTDPISYGEADRDQTYEEAVAEYEREIEDGGRGNLSPEDVRENLEAFKDRWTPEEFNTKACHDCGANRGEYHHPGCDWEECPRCGGQYFICECRTGEKDVLWGKADA